MRDIRVDFNESDAGDVCPRLEKSYGRMEVLFRGFHPLQVRLIVDRLLLQVILCERRDGAQRNGLDIVREASVASSIVLPQWEALRRGR